MRRRLRRAQDSADVNMTPMLDIVFILLIFFIVTATFLQENGVEMIQPQSDEQPENPTNAPSILVTVDANNFVFINNRMVDVARVTAGIQRQMVDNRAAGRSAVVIRSHVDAHHGIVTRVFDAANASGAVGVVVREPEDF